MLCVTNCGTDIEFKTEFFKFDGMKNHVMSALQMLEYLVGISQVEF
jgi:hypothetical protein